ncbi:MAG: hypothetical protein AAGH15_03345 [Myxococcota bacterium]
MRAALAALALALAACGGGPPCVIDTDCPLGNACIAEECVSTGQGDPDAGTRDFGPPDEMGPEDAGLPDMPPADMGLPVLRNGLVVASSNTRFADGVEFPSSSLLAFFVEVPNPSCVESTEGACTVLDCTTEAGGDMGPGDMGPEMGGTDLGSEMGPEDMSVTAPNADFVSVDGGLLDEDGGGITLGFFPNPEDGRYMPERRNDALWLAGTRVTFMGTGAEVPGFETAVVGPGLLTLSSPVTLDGLRVDPSVELPLAWTGDSEGELVVRFSYTAAEPRTGTVSVSCAFDPAAGSGAIPAAVWEPIPRGLELGVTLHTQGSRELALAGGWNVRVQARTQVLATDRARGAGGSLVVGLTSME